MANEDYVKRGIAGPYCPTANLTSSLTRLATSLTYTGLQSTIPDPIQINRAALIDDEIIAITGISGNTLTIERGCCDTIPAAHASNAVIWFFDDSVGSDETEYGGTETIGVKLLPRTATSGTIPISGSPPNQVTFNFRFARPYPPGNVQIDGEPWFTTGIAMGPGNTSLTISWAHRDRITQADQLVGHTAASIGPEVGVTYKIVVRRTDTNAVIRTVTGITDDEWIYERSVAGSDLAGASGSVPISIELSAVRGSLESLYKYTMVATVSPPPPPISFIGSNSVNASGSSPISVPAHQVGDLILLFQRGNSPTPPGTPSGWTSVLVEPSTGGIGNGWRLSMKVDTDNSINSIEVTFFENVVLVYRGVSGIGQAVLDPYDLGPTSISLPSATLNSGGSSWVLGLFSINQGGTLTATGGLVTRGGFSGVMAADSNGGVSSVAGGASWSTGAYVSAATIELLQA